ncbi:MAG: cyclic nucleotide-binding domain-containing protein [Bacteriovorax sp.]|jgi:CRP-like cAMP-binding protein|nr:cyclic nucleotide-binding domain-containing protein [Bacteriovorax sp.]
MSKIEAINLENQSVMEIKKISSEKKYNTQCPLFYEGQVPIVAYLLIEGCIQLIKNKKIKKILKPGALIGLSELMTNSPAKLSALVQPESTLCFLDKSTIKEIIHDDNTSLAQLLKEEVR